MESSEIKLITKKCSYCKKEKDISLFRAGRGKLNKKNYCIICDDKKSKENYIKNKGKRISQSIKWAKLNPDKVQKYKLKYHQKVQKS